MKSLNKYPRREFPSARLVKETRRRGRENPEYELIDTGVFDESRYFDVLVEYAKASEEDILVRITAWNRGPEPAELHLLPTLWFRNRWSWERGDQRPQATNVESPDGRSLVKVEHEYYGERWLVAEETPELLFTENETNFERLFGAENGSAGVKDAIDAAVMLGVVGSAELEPIAADVRGHFGAG